MNVIRIYASITSAAPLLIGAVTWNLGGNGNYYLRREDCAVGKLDAGWGDEEEAGDRDYNLLASSSAYFLSCSGGISFFWQTPLYNSESFNLLIFDKYPSN